MFVSFAPSEGTRQVSALDSSAAAAELKAREQSSADATTIDHLRAELNAERAMRLELEKGVAGNALCRCRALRPSNVGACAQC